ncbi:hypothetical protein HOY80DRAFT_347414 [Tuber brumale]|nr:hypothetical protein HOY80DRAFT_347414 [Tuber brumale]
MNTANPPQFKHLSCPPWRSRLARWSLHLRRCCGCRESSPWFLAAGYFVGHRPIWCCDICPPPTFCFNYRLPSSHGYILFISLLLFLIHPPKCLCFLGKFPIQKFKKERPCPPLPNPLSVTRITPPLRSRYCAVFPILDLVIICSNPHPSA